MALSRLCWKTNSLFPKSLAVLPHRSPSSSLSPSQRCRAHQCYFSNSAATPCRPLNLRQLARELPSRGFAAAAGSTSPASSSEQEKTGEISTTVSTDSDKPAPEWKRERGGLRRRRNRSRRDLVPFGGGGFGSALWQATEGMNRLLRSLSPWHLFRRLKDEDKAYKLQLEVPGLSKDDLRVTVEDNYLVIRGEKKQEADQESRDEEGEYWASSRSYDYYDTWCMLPEDAKVDEIKAEVKHGMLYVTIPRAEDKKTDVVEVEVH